MIMRKEIIMWVEDADYDLECAMDMLEKKRYNYAVFLSRQSVEKILKASNMVILKKPIPKEHNLIELAKCFKKLPSKIMDNIIFLNPHYTVARYVNASLDLPSKLYDERFASESVKRGKEVIKWVKKAVKTK